eukprot:m.152824 g.152824  ORF g.152824 m.152824 type:complete len:230 (+) comp14272_c2_seq4:100-789(+)
MAASTQAIQRLRKEYRAIQANPPPFIEAVPLSSNILEWHYCISGLVDPPYNEGVYHGKLVFPPNYPLKPPAIYMITPNGRFATNTKLCLSISDFHPDTWNPAWSVESIIKGLLSFMLDNVPTAGSITTTDKEKVKFARQSLAFNLVDAQFRELFPERTEAIRLKLVDIKQQQDALAGSSASASTPRRVEVADSEETTRKEQRMKFEHTVNMLVFMLPVFVVLLAFVMYY